MRATALLGGLILATTANAGIVTKAIEYKHGDVVLEGYLAYDDTVQGKRPGVLVVHEWWGLNPAAKQRAEELAKLGYVGFAVDMYGKGVLTDDPGQAGKLAGALYGKPILRERIRLAYDLLAMHQMVDADRIGAIGFCFGGTTCLELAYSGAKLSGIVSFHGSLTVPKEGEGPNIKSKILVLHGADDPMVPPEKVQAFEDSMRAAKTDWQLVAYGNAVHAFTQPDADKRNIPGVKFNAAAAKRSWEHMSWFFKEAFGK